MKLIATFIVGAILGAAALFFALVNSADREAASVAPPLLNVPAPVASAPAVQAPADGAPAGTLPAPADPALAGAPPAGADAAGAPLPPVADASLADAKLPEQPDYLAKQTGGIAPSSSTSSGAAKLMVPVEGIKAEQLSDTFGQPRGKERQHEAMDIMAPKGTKVFAVADGKIAKLFNSKPGGLTVYQFDPSETHSYYYAHLDRYAEGLKEGQQVKQGDLIGYVGTTGNADPKSPHLHFAVFELTPKKEWWKGKAVNPLPMLR